MPTRIASKVVLTNLFDLPALFRSLAWRGSGGRTLAALLKSTANQSCNTIQKRTQDFCHVSFVTWYRPVANARIGRTGESTPDLLSLNEK